MTTPRAALVGRTVLYGGSFDPPHMSHQMACLVLLEALGAEAVWLLPTYVHPLGKTQTSFAHRMAMCKRLAAALGDRVAVHDTERRLGGQGRTIDLVEALQKAHPSTAFTLAVGADIIGQTHRWHRWAALTALLPITVIGRTGYAAAAQTFDLPGIASSDVRCRLAAGASVTGLVPVDVRAYIEAHNLYAPSLP